VPTQPCWRLDDSATQILTTTLDELMVRGPHHFVIDLSDVNSVDESGAQALARVAHVLSRANGSVTFLVPKRLADGPLADCGIELIVPPAGAGDAAPVIGVPRAG